MSRKNSVPDLPKNNKFLNSWKSVIVPSRLILMLIFTAGILMINSLSSFYYKERIQEASLLAKSYARVLSTVIDAEHQLDLQMYSTLKVAGVAVSKYVVPISFAHQIDKLVIAGCVGTRAQEGEPQKLDCDYMQGYLYSRPLAAEQAFLPMESAQDDDE